MSIEKYDYLWKDGKDSRWMLVPIKNTERHTIYGYNDRGELVSLLIEDEEIHTAIVRKMIAVGVKVVDQSELSDILRPTWANDNRDLASDLDTIRNLTSDINQSEDS